MILKSLTAAAALVLAMGAGAAAADTPYEAMVYAEAIDENCGFMPYIEHYVLSDLAWQAVEDSSLNATALKMGDKDAVPNLYQQQKDKAKALGCTDPVAVGTVQTFRGQVISELAIAVVTANLRYQRANGDASADSLFDFSSMYTAPSDDEMNDARRVDGYIQGLLSADDYQKLGPYATQVAQQRLEADKTDSDGHWSVYLYNVDYQARAEQDHAALVAGPSPWQRYKTQDGKVALTQRTASFGAFSAFVYMVVRDGQVSAAAHAMDAENADAVKGLRLYLRKTGAPATKNDLPLSWDASWRANATAFDMTATNDKMFGGATVYTLPAPAIAALKALTPDEEVEVAIVGADGDGQSLSGTSRARFRVKDILAALVP